MIRCCLALLLFLFAVNGLAATSQALVKQGEYLVRAAGCVSCHTDHPNEGAYLAGGRALETPFGTFYSPNITSDPVNGIGNWSDEDFVQTLQHGVTPDGGNYYPVFPYTSYTRLRVEDVKAIAAYLRSTKAESLKDKEHDLPWYLFRWMIGIWKWLYFEPGEFRDDPDKDQVHNRGAYLVAIGHCTECHTPRNQQGVLDRERFLAGSKQGVEGEAVPNITPDQSTGIGKWSESDLAWFLKTGELPDGDYTGSKMAEVVDDGTSHMSDTDLKSMALYIKELPAIRNNDFVKKKKKRKVVEDEW